MVKTKSSSIQLQPRDLELFRGLFDSRIMTLRHIAAIHFDDHTEAAKKRVHKLKAAGYLRERPRTANESSIHFLTRKAFNTLSQDGMLPEIPRMGWAAQEKRMKVSDLTLRHELGVMDCKAAFFAAVRSHPKLSITSFSTWPFRIQFKSVLSDSEGKVIVRPDGFISLEDTSQGTRKLFFFLEVDYSTEPLGTLADKLRRYRNYYRQGEFARLLGYNSVEYRKCPFRVLVVCKSAERCDHLSEFLRTSYPPISAFACTTTFEKFVADPLQTIGLPYSEH